ncbi:phosphotransferase [Streptomyces sp. NPDC002643]
MTDPHQLPAPIRIWAENTLGALSTVRDASPEDPLPGLWHVVRACDRACFVIKIARTPGAFTRETFAHRHAVPALGQGNAPRLLATSPRHLALIVTSLTGTPLPQLRLQDAALKAVHWRAGSLVAQLHQAGRPAGDAHREAPSVLSRIADESARHLDAASNWLSAGNEKFVRDHADRLRVIDRLPLGFIHGGVIETSLLWSGKSQLTLRDFESSHFAPVVLDFVHLACGLWATRPRLRSAFFGGYGRILGHDERLALRCLTALHAARSLAEGHLHDDPAAAKRGRAVLDRLKNEVNA